MAFGDIRTFLIQAIDLCNLNCSYCYLPGRKDPTPMSHAILEKTLSLIFGWDRVGDKIRIDWNAGEPLTAKMAYYEFAFGRIQKENTRGIVVEQNIQTNATLLTPEWCAFLCKHKVGVGISVDGPDFIHDRYRKNWKNKGSHLLVQKGIQCLKEYRSQLSAVCVLTNYSLDFPDEIFDYFVSNGFKSVGFNIEELEGFNHTSSLFSDKNISEEIACRYLQFMTKLYARWKQNPEKIEIREFIQFRKKFSQIYFGKSLQLLQPETRFLDVITISKTGNLFAFSPELSGGIATDPNAFVVGNVMEIDSFNDIERHPNFIKLNQEIQTGVKMCKDSCEYFPVCGGGFPVNKYSENKTFESTETGQCKLSIQLLADFLLKEWQLSPNGS